MDPSAIGLFCAWWVATTGVHKLFKDQEELMRPEVRDGISRWLQRPLFRKLTNSWIAHFRELFDQVFGSRHLTWYCARRSFLVTFIAISVLTILWASLYPVELVAFMHSPRVAVYVVALVAAVLLCSFPADYISLLKTRFMIGRLGNTSSLRSAAGILLLDVILTCVGILAIGLPFARFVYIPAFFPDGAPSHIWMGFLSPWQVRHTLMLHAEQDWFPIGVIFYSAFFTSAWLLLFGAGALAVRVLRRMDTLRRALVHWCDVDKHPVAVIGMAVNVLLTLLFAMVFILRLMGPMEGPRPRKVGRLGPATGIPTTAGDVALARHI